MSEDWDFEDNEESIIRKCPFCGGVAVEQEDNDMETVIECSICEASIYRHEGDGDDYVVRCRTAWNKRICHG